MNPAKFEWMLAHVRLNSQADPTFWSPETVVKTFCLLLPPVVPFDVWCSLVGITPEGKPSDDAIAEHNTRALGLLSATAPMAQKVD